MRIFVQERSTPYATLTFPRQVIYIGSRPNCAVHLPDLRVANQHAVLVPEGATGWLVEQVDRESTTYLNSSLLVGRQRVKNGDEIRIAEFVLKIYLGLDRTAEQEVAREQQRLTQITKYPLPDGAAVKKSQDSYTLQSGRLEGLGAIAAAICEADSVDSLADQTLTHALSLFDARRVWVGFRPHPRGDLEYAVSRSAEGVPGAPPGLIETITYRCLERAQHLNLPRSPENKMGPSMAVPLAGPKGPLGVICVEAKPGARGYRESDLDHLTLLGMVVLGRLQSVMHAGPRESAEPSAVEEHVLRSVQGYLNPVVLPDWPELHLAVHHRPGLRLCGDLHDALTLPNKSAALLFAHPNASGCDGSALLAQARAAFRVASVHLDRPHVLLRELNWLIYDGHPEHTLRCVAAMIEPTSGQLHYCIAGRPNVLLVTATGKVLPLGHPEQPEIGRIPNHQYTPESIQMEPGDTLAIISRGILALTNERGEAFAEARLMESLASAGGENLDGVVAEVTAQIDAFLRGQDPPEDITLLLAQRALRKPAG